MLLNRTIISQYLASYNWPSWDWRTGWENAFNEKMADYPAGRPAAWIKRVLLLFVHGITKDSSLDCSLITICMISCSRVWGPLIKWYIKMYCLVRATRCIHTHIALCRKNQLNVLKLWVLVLHLANGPCMLWRPLRLTSVITCIQCWLQLLVENQYIIHDLKPPLGEWSPH